MNWREFISKGESETAEFKKSPAEWKEIIETISAFSNTKGGIVLVGVDNNGRVHGLTLGKNTIEDLTNKILTNTEPKIYPQINLVSVENKRIAVIKVERFPSTLIKRKLMRQICVRYVSDESDYWHFACCDRQSESNSVERKNMVIVEEVYRTLKADKETQVWIEKIQQMV